MSDRDETSGLGDIHTVNYDSLEQEFREHVRQSLVTTIAELRSWLTDSEIMALVVDELDR